MTLDCHGSYKLVHARVGPSWFDVYEGCQLTCLTGLAGLAGLAGVARLDGLAGFAFHESPT